MNKEAKLFRILSLMWFKRYTPLQREYRKLLYLSVYPLRWADEYTKDTYA